jgi:hypothetical protein
MGKSVAHLMTRTHRPASDLTPKAGPHGPVFSVLWTDFAFAERWASSVVEPPRDLDVATAIAIRFM